MAKSGIHIKKSKKGSLHKALGVKQGEKIPASKLKIKSTDSPAMKKKKQFAINAKKFKHQTGGHEYNKPFVPKNTLAINAQQDAQLLQSQDPDQMNNPADPNNPGFDVYGNPIQQQGQGVQQGQWQPPQTQQNQQQSQREKLQGKGKMRFLDSPQGKAFNAGVEGITGIANAVQNSQLKHKEKLQVLDSMTPRFMTNPEAQGLNNGPAYTKYGGDGNRMGAPISHGEPIGIVDSHSGGSGLDDSMYEGVHNNSFYGQNQIYTGETSKYRTGGTVSAEKAKEILHDGTAQGHPLTDKQRRYFGWIAGGKKQVGGAVPGIPGPLSTPAPAATNPASADDYYGANATLSYFKNQLNDKLKAKNPEAYGNYFKGLQGARSSGKPEDASNYIQGSDYNDYLSPDDVKSTLGDNYSKYINSLQTVNRYNVQQGKQPLYGTVEGEQDVNKLNYGRRFASLQVTPKFGQHVTNAQGQGQDYSRQYNYNPQTGGVDIQESGDVSIRPKTFKPIPPAGTPTASSRQTGGDNDEGRNEGRDNDSDDYAVGDEVELSSAQIKALKKKGYKIKSI